ncbi:MULTISPECIES: DNA-binding protein [Rhodanobacter]|uniref:DNA-binding protein n=1 Tax=Rhodanobacter TaxID=75309 RepID=UPI000485860F|nr:MULTISPECIES: DNA-binding protein [Rhodanobacter]TAM07649.1 MAG: DNA-binding protein [Rhodanobacter sp.]UJJ53411.1 DNA-binding protein [Rhodanobacter thiooxydans]UJJ53475.1 DNA-binding protein [Rhodanobacter thiooxydans]
MAIGVPETEVIAAADRVLARGERPTVERVRSELGRGSPARVGQLLETWWEALAQRMAGEARLPELPPEVAAAFRAVWVSASEHATAGAQAALAQEQNALLAAQTSLTQERKIWEIAIAEAQVLAQSAGQAREVAETRLTDVQRLVEQQTTQLNELNRQRDGLQQRADQLAEALETHKSTVNAEREAQSQHLRAVEDRAHAEIDRAREETKTLQATLRQKERETSAIASRLETAMASARAADHLATEHGARASTLEQQLARMDGLPAALLAAQQALQAATLREAALHTKLESLKLKPSRTRKKSPDPSGSR